MTIAMTIDAVSRSEIDWHAVNWRKVYRTVRRLQARIVKAKLRSRVSQKALERLELHEAKVTSGVLRGRRVSNGSLLPGAVGKVPIG